MPDPFCSHCGKPLPADDLFCRYCGTPTRIQPAVQPAQTPAPLPGSASKQPGWLKATAVVLFVLIALVACIGLGVILVHPNQQAPFSLAIIARSTAYPTGTPYRTARPLQPSTPYPEQTTYPTHQPYPTTGPLSTLYIVPTPTPTVETSGYVPNPDLPIYIPTYSFSLYGRYCSIEVHNLNVQDDAVVALTDVDANQNAAVLYVRGRDNAEISTLGTGTYMVYVLIGRDWNPLTNRFDTPITSFRSSQSFTFTDCSFTLPASIYGPYDVPDHLEITLYNELPGADSVEIPPESFPLATP